MQSRQINPFYIENSDKEEWEEDWRYDDDDDDFEQEGLLAPQDVRAYYHRHQRHSPRNGQHSATTTIPIRYCLAFSVVFLMFMILLSLAQNGDSTGQMNDASTRDKPHHANNNSSNESSVVDDQVEVVILGERHSGVEWLADTLQDCYPNRTIQTRLVRDAYWFQTGPTQNDTRKLLLVTVFRNPYDWLLQMHQHPLYMPAHTNNSQPLELREFLTTPWTMPNYTFDNTLQTCQLGFRVDQVVPCHAMGDPNNATMNAIYELDGQGRPFDSIVNLRAAKIQHLVQQVPQLWYDLLAAKPLIVQYETTLLDTLVQIHDAVGWNWTCVDSNITAPPSELPLEEWFQEWVKKNMNWTIESEIGYHSH